MTQIVCSMRGVECDCNQSRCKAAPVTEPWSSWFDRVVRASLRFTVVMVVAISIGSGTYALLSRLDYSLHQDQLYHQEDSVAWQR